MTTPPSMRKLVQNMPPSSYRPSPPSTRPVRLMPRPEETPSAPPEPARETTLVSRPEPEAPPVPRKKGRSPESIRRQKATWAAKKAAEAEAPARPAKREPRTREVAALAQHEVLAESLISSLASMVRTIVREEIRRMLA